MYFILYKFRYQFIILRIFLIQVAALFFNSSLWCSYNFRYFFFCGTFITLYIYIYICIYRVSREECARLRKSVPCVKVYRYNPKHLYPKLNGYGDNGQRSLNILTAVTHLLITKYILKLAEICCFCNVNICT